MCAHEIEVREAIAGADVIVTTSDAPAPERAETLASLSPDAVHLSITPHGLADPLTGVPGNNLTMSARVGWASINGVVGEPPLQMPRDQSGVVGGVAGFITACAALRRRHAGDTELVDVSELEAFALTVHPWGVAAVYQGAGTNQNPQRSGAREAPPRERSPGGGAAAWRSGSVVGPGRRSDELRPCGLPQLDRSHGRDEPAGTGPSP